MGAQVSQSDLTVCFIGMSEPPLGLPRWIKALPMSNFEITRLTPDRWQLYKSIRLQALKDAPDSYGSTLEQEAAMSDTEWKSRLDLEMRDITALPLVATKNGEPVGLAWGLVDAQASAIAHVYQMWVSPTVRGRGIGKLLLREITSWAVGRRCTHMRLAVTTSNDAAAPPL